MTTLSIGRFLSICLFVMATAVNPALAERFQGGNTAFRTPDGKWVKARIEVGPERIEVFHKRGRRPDRDTLVAKFERVSSEADLAYLQTVETHRRWKRGVIFGVVSGVVLAGANIALRRVADEVDEAAHEADDEFNGVGDTVGSVTSQVRDKLPLATLVAAGGLGALAIVRGMGKVDRPRRHLKQGLTEVTLRIARKDLGRFDLAMEGFGAASN